jgi:hypothetical protein
LELELDDVTVMEIVLVDRLRPVPAEDHLATMVGDLHPLAAEAAPDKGTLRGSGILIHSRSASWNHGGMTSMWRSSMLSCT